MSTITWLSIKVFLSRAWSWCKKYWQLFIGALIPVIIWTLTRNSSKLDDVVARVRKDHQHEIDIINKSHDAELLARAQAEKVYLETVSKIEDKSRKDFQELSLKKKKEIKQIVNEHVDNPDEITRRLADELGLHVMTRD